MLDGLGSTDLQLISDPDGINNGSGINDDLGNFDNVIEFGPFSHSG
jgi:hypothetical protein